MEADQGETATAVGVQIRRALQGRRDGGRAGAVDARRGELRQRQSARLAGRCDRMDRAVPQRRETASGRLSNAVDEPAPEEGDRVD